MRLAGCKLIQVLLTVLGLIFAYRLRVYDMIKWFLIDEGSAYSRVMIYDVLVEAETDGQLDTG